MTLLKWLLPTLAGLLLAAIIIVPLSSVQEFSFLLAKDKVAAATERLRVDRAVYRGETARGEPFIIKAAGAVQKSSAVPEVELQKLSAELDSAEGPAVVTAPAGRYFIETDILRVMGPVKLTSEAGYTVDTGSIDVDLNARTVKSEQAVSGTLPIGNFSADRISADVQGRVVVLEGSAHLRIKARAGRAS
ncbi:LPS export ABC transporter periplasmic protein LptC [Polymorphobacter sp.]|uniref:LPS export ABC transporter periplasmic protein LptC n=1 Tax=Polymorphobacter sp. TaxID=1909290 RepID=UPI003F72B5A2